MEKLILDPSAYPNASELLKPENLGRLKTTTAMGDVDNDGDVDQIYAYGGRSFSIWDTHGNLVFDSGNEFENIIAQKNPEIFNADGSAAKVDERSDDKGLEPEAITTGVIDGKTYVFIGMERNNVIFVYNISDVDNVIIAGYAEPLAIHNSVEGLEFISAENSPTGAPLLIAAYEMTGSIVVYEIVE